MSYSTFESKQKIIFSYDDVSGEPEPNKAKNINGYLLDTPTIFFDKVTQQISNELTMFKGCQPNDGGNLLLSNDEYEELIQQEPIASKYMRPYMMGYEFLNNIKRWCLWFDNVF